MSAKSPPPARATARFSAVILALAAAGFLAVSAGQALASHVGCGAVVTTDTRLDSDLGSCPGNGVVIGSDGITRPHRPHHLGHGRHWGRHQRGSRRRPDRRRHGQSLL
jgi:hypothetical protein